MPIMKFRNNGEAYFEYERLHKKKNKKRMKHIQKMKKKSRKINMKRK